MNLIGELLGTFILVLLGNGVVASCILSKTKPILSTKTWLSSTKSFSVIHFLL